MGTIGLFLHSMSSFKWCKEMCGLVCFGLEVKFHFLGIKAAKLSVCTLCTLFLAQQNVKAGPKNLGDQTGLTFTRLHCCLLS